MGSSKKNLPWQAKQSVLHRVAWCNCDVSWWLHENLRRLCPQTLATTELAVTSWQHTSFFSREFFLPKKQHDCHLPPTLLAWLDPLWLFSVFHHFDPIEVTEVESQVALNTVTAGYI
jgi:hypothetical protein